MKYFYNIFLIVIFIITACRKEVLLTGEIAGRIIICDQYYNYISDRSGVEVNLYRENDLVSTAITDITGFYRFSNIPYGKYNIIPRKSNYIHSWKPPFIYHVGGFSPTYVYRHLYEVPTYDIKIDSISYYPGDYYLSSYLLYLKVNNDTSITYNPYGYSFIAYVGQSKEVSKDNYVAFNKGFLYDRWGYNKPRVAVFGLIPRYSFIPDNIEKLFSDSVYLRIYPLAGGQGYGASQFYTQALGKPSNVICFVLKDLF